VAIRAFVPGYLDLLTAVGDTLFFVTDDGVHGEELWKSDGTEAGTVLVRDINTDTGSANPQQLAAVGDRLFFSADDGPHGQELWALVAISLPFARYLPLIVR
jgi:ELWxxDGT repeat protein